jgi:hypothetical protein
MTVDNPFGRSALLRGLAEELDPPLDQKQLASERYGDLGVWLQEHAATTAGRDVQVYPQGSGNLGTTNRDRRRHSGEDASKLTRLTTALRLAYRSPTDLEELLFNARLMPRRPTAGADVSAISQRH